MFFDPVNFNGEVFDALVKETPNLNLNALLKSGAVVPAPQYATQMRDQMGGHYATTLIKARIGGTPVNYDGGTDIDSTERGNYTMGRIVVGRANGWTEKDFVSDISGNDYSAAVTEVAEYWDDVDQATLLSILKGIFNMTGTENLKFVNSHTYNISNAAAPKFSETTLNTGIQKALGDNKGKFSLAVMHSQVSTNLENLKLLAYMKYTDAQGIERDLSLGTINGRMVLIDDNMPSEEGYFDAASDTTGALKIVASGAAAGEINLSAAAYNDPELDGADKTQVLIEILYPDYAMISPDCLEEAVKKALWFIDAGLPAGDNKPKPVLMDWVKDGPIIIPEINKYVGKEVRSVDYMHWWTFFGAYMQIGGDGLYSQIQNIRQKKAKSKKLEKWEAEFYRENKALCDLDYEKNQAELEEVKKIFG